MSFKKFSTAQTAAKKDKPAEPSKAETAADVQDKAETPTPVPTTTKS